ncbi:UDP glucuronosyltransferase 5 family, polypeptide G1 [Synchiropus splendidus]|uniref:UDP glucuronosyltransferase 5 family, polypeptide G1 n=1 Tax=Synchiropus splendidus TaxID=270530 RepID=UPI00237DCE53|nr:UDP glucuronosyltransferase 5 family, polypeptide G1 [Synchiropus splendidus]XP_053715934.1 UDP glucuronosyltransferase 5 family, polypeptide G1 [Synchiropus splendidus]XP_053715935.1 UDP glucuronosyltransferase 5 family, polypeptide G1 [Synchiropus splendidus]
MVRSLSTVLPVLLIFSLAAAFCDGSKILVVPLDGSHWINMNVILQELHARGHELTVLRSAKSWYIPKDSPIYTSIEVKTLEDETDPNVYSKMLLDVVECRKWPQFFSGFCQQSLITRIQKNGHAILARAAASLLDDPVFMKNMQDMKFDLMLTDPALTLGIILGSYLKLPMVCNVRWMNTGESHFSIAPSPLSYVPVPGTELHDQMDFVDRTKNVLYYIFSVFEHQYVIEPAYFELFRRHFPPGTSLLSLERQADIWLMRTDFVFEFPRPTMPNVIYIGGFQSKAAKPLPDDLEAFVQSSGEHGVVMMSLGTIVSALSKEMTEEIAAAFAELPQKVIWKFLGEKPSTLGNNTLLVDWLPQKDLLGHPKTRAFVAHGGTNGLYEAIYHGVPVVCLPLLFDQFDNGQRLKVRGAAQVVEAKSLTKDTFLEALKDVLETPSYRQNIQRMSKLHRDHAVPPLDTAIFWIEYVIRNQGAAHLRSEAFNLTWYSYYCLDVAALLAAVIGGIFWGSLALCRICCCRKSKKKKTKSE